STGTTRYADDRRGPFDCDVENGFLGDGEEVKRYLSGAGLHLSDQDPAVLEAVDAELADGIGRHRPADVFIEDKPAVEARPQAGGPDRYGYGILGRARGINLVKIALDHFVKMRLGTGTDIPDNRHFWRR